MKFLILFLNAILFSINNFYNETFTLFLAWTIFIIQNFILPSHFFIGFTIEGPCHLYIRNLYGQLCKEFVLSDDGTIHLEALPTGAYTLTLVSHDGKTQSTRFQKSAH